MVLRGFCPDCREPTDVEARPMPDVQDKSGEITLELFCSEGHPITKVTGPVEHIREAYGKP